MISARVQLTKTSNHVLNVVKAKYELKDKSAAINKLIELTADEFIDRDASNKYVKKMLKEVDDHMKKYPNRRMSLKELDALTS